MHTIQEQRKQVKQDSEAASAIKSVGGIMDQHPDKTIQALYKVFGEGGIVGEAIDMTKIPGSDGGIVEQQKPPAGAMYAA